MQRFRFKIENRMIDNNNIYGNIPFLEITNGKMIHEYMGMTWKHFRKHYLIPMNHSPHEWEIFKFQGKIPMGATHPLSRN